MTGRHYLQVSALAALERRDAETRATEFEERLRQEEEDPVDRIREMNNRPEWRAPPSRDSVPTTLGGNNEVGRESVHGEEALVLPHSTEVSMPTLRSMQSSTELTEPRQNIPWLPIPGSHDGTDGPPTPMSHAMSVKERDQRSVKKEAPSVKARNEKASRENATEGILGQGGIAMFLEALEGLDI